MHRVIGLAGALIIWEVAARWVQSPMFVPVTEVLPALIQLFVSGEIFMHIQASLLNILIGFSIAVIIGLALGILVTESKIAQSILTPILDAMRPIAALTIFPLLIILLGLGMWSKVFVIFWTAWPAVLLNTAEGVRQVSKSVQEAAALDGADGLIMLRHITLPLALPTIITGLRIGMGGGWISLVSSEMLGAHAGLGYSILAYSQTFRFPQMYAVIIVIALLGLSMNLALAWLQNKIDWERSGDVQESRFIRFHDRAASWVLDSPGWMQSATG